MRLLVIEDNPKLSGLLRQGLAEHGYSVDVSSTGGEGGRLASTNHYDCIILDVMLPDANGIDVCGELRRNGVRSPLLMLTVLNSTSDKVNGLDAGADDYMTKPFDFDELVARVRSLLRRRQGTEQRIIRFADIEMDLDARRTTRAGKRINLSQKEFAMLELFMRNPDRVLSRAFIGKEVWDMKFESDSNVIDVYVHTLRRKIESGFDSRLIHTVIGSGYMLSADRESS